MKRLLLLISLLFILVNSYSQRATKFSTNHEAFFTELTAFYASEEKREDRKEGEALIEKFTPFWNNLSDVKKDAVIANCNRMIDRKMRPFPHFKIYINTLINFENARQNESNFKNFHLVLENLIEKSRGRNYMTFLEFCENLFLDNTLYKSPTTRWTADNSGYELKYEEDSPYLIFNSLNLTGYANNDSTVIYKTKGRYYPIENNWKGVGGLVTWERAGFSRDMVWAELKNYDINLKFSKYEIDSVTFYNKNFFNDPLMGSLSEKVLANVTPDKASYPQFKSYDLRLKIDNIFEDVNYEGGFTMQGAKLHGSGDKDTDAYLTFKREGKPFIVAGSMIFVISKDKISSADAKVTIYFDKDSIYHPSIQLKYIDSKKEVSFLRDKNGLSNSPYFNSFHNLDMYFEAFYWNMKEPKIDLQMVKGLGSESNALFESSNYFSQFRYEKIQSLDDVNPLTIILNYSRKFKTKEFTLTDMAAYMRISTEQTKVVLLNLANMGFLMYDLNYDKIIIKDRLLQYCNSRAGKIDYDVIQFNSSVNKGVNASINLLNFDLNLNGVESVFLSDSQNVVIYPKDQKLTVKKNRDFAFDGKVKAGLFDYYGKLFTFEYNNFKLNMPVVDSLSFRVFDKTKQPDNYGKYPLVRVKSVIQDISGELLIDQPNNKSGLKPFNEYPIFNSKKDAFVFYNKSYIQNGVYTKDRFYFHLEPFTIDSLNTFSTEGLEFKGYLASADIFPDIYEPLKVQPDFSLGFIKKTPPSGLPVYKGKGTYHDLINLSNKGLIGHGTLDYLASVSQSDKFVFFPDSMRALVQEFDLKEQVAAVEYPQVSGKDVDEKWLPYDDKMIVAKIDNPIEMYNKQSKLNGAVTLSPTDLTGRGTMVFNDAEMDSRLFKFKQHFFDADTADFRLKTYDLSDLAFSTKNYKSHIDFVKRKGEFKSNGGGSKVEFPVNQYICFMDEFDWYMDKEEIELAVDVSKQKKDLEGKTIKELADIDISGSEFISVHPDQDSLRFVSPRAKYNLRNNIIYAQDVKIIKVADAAIFPGDGNVTIYKKAQMETLKNAQILANMVTRFHTMYNANINILSRKKYQGEAYYDYIDETEKKQLIFFDAVGVDTTVQTYAKGSIRKEKNFTLSPDFDYNGNITLTASKEFLKFDGATRIKQSCDTNKVYWLKFNADLNPKEIYIPIPEAIKDENNTPLFISLMHSSDTLYSAFLKPKIKSTDFPVVSANGFLFFDKTRRQYKVASMDKLRQFNLPGNYFSLDRDNCFTYSEGKLNLTTGLGRVQFDVYGNIENVIATGKTDIDAFIILDFYFLDDAMKIFTDNLEKYNDLQPVDISSETYAKSLSSVIGIEAADKFISDLNLVGRVKGRFPEELQKTFVLSKVNLTWNSQTKSYQSFGKIGIGNMQKNLINKYVNGYVELVQKRGGDVLNVYFELDAGDWYFFSYQNRVMQAWSSHKEFMQKITEVKPQNRKLKSDKGEAPYSYYVSSERRVKEFLKKFQNEDEDKGTKDEEKNDKEEKVKEEK